MLDFKTLLVQLPHLLTHLSLTSDHLKTIERDRRGDGFDHRTQADGVRVFPQSEQ